MKAVSMIETMKAKMEALEGEIEDEGFATSENEKKATVEAPKPPMFKGALDVLKVDNFFWHLEIYFKCNKVKNNETRSTPSCCTSLRWP